MRLRSLALAAVLAALPPLCHATFPDLPLRTIDSAITNSKAQLKSDRNLLLFVRDSEQLKVAQGLLTYCEATDIRGVIVLVSPDSSPNETRKLRFLASSFFRSEFSKQRVFILEIPDLLPAEVSAILLDANGQSAWQADHLPYIEEFAEFATSPAK